MSRTVRSRRGLSNKAGEAKDEGRARSRPYAPQYAAHEKNTVIHCRPIIAYCDVNAALIVRRSQANLGSVRFLGNGCRRHYIDDVIVVVPKIAQEGRLHGRRVQGDFLARSLADW